MDSIKKIFEDSELWKQSLIAWGMWTFAHINYITGVIALLVVSYQLKTSFYKSKITKMEYKKIKNEYQTSKNRRKK